jgi:hypothetical protein
MNVNPFKIIGWVALAIAIVGAFLSEGIPYADAILVVLGFVAGYAIASEDHVRVLVSALVLNALPGVLLPIPEIGDYLARIVGDIGTFAAGVALMIVFRNIWRRYRP